MAKEYVPIFFDWLDTTQDLTAEEKGNLIDAVVAYASGQEYEHLLTGGCKIAFRFLKGQVDRNNAISESRSKAGSNKPQQNGTNDNKQEQTATNSPKEKDKDKEKEKENNNKRFIPPTVDEVAAYCKERGNNIDPQYFVDYQTSRDWILSNGKKCKDWRATVRTWENHSYERKPPVKVVPAQQYAQRDYKSEQDEALKRMLTLGGA